MKNRRQAHEKLENFLSQQITTLSNILRRLDDSDFLRKEQQIINRFILRVPHLKVKEARLRRNMAPDRTCNIVMDVHYEGSTELLGLKCGETTSCHCHEEHIWSETTLRLHTKVEELNDEIKMHLKQNILDRMQSIELMIDPVRWHNQRVEDMIERHRKTVELRSGIIKDDQEKKGFFDFIFGRKNEEKASESVTA